MHTQRSGKQAKAFKSRWQQHGVILPVFAVGMLAILAMAGLALDMSHALLNKARLQNSVDAAALMAAKTLDEGGNIGAAEAAAVQIFADNAAGDGNGEMTGVSIDVEFSATVDPFVTGTTPAEYVRVRADEFTMGAWLIQLIGFDEKTVGASAVSGPSPTLGTQVCDLSPFIVCADPGATIEDEFFGYRLNDVNMLKGSSKTGSVKGDIGPGNFYTARLGESTGGADMRINAAGGFEGCALAGDNIDLEPGNQSGPVGQGIATRLDCPPGSACGPLKDSTEYPPDLITTVQDDDFVSDGRKIYLHDELINDPLVADRDSPEAGIGIAGLDFTYQDYLAQLDDVTVTKNPDGVANRRNLTVTIADCTPRAAGASSLPIMGFGCYFLLQDVAKGGNKNEVYGQFNDSCEASGNTGPDPTDIPGPDKIILYKDSDSIDS
jgi:hypothetical protein